MPPREITIDGETFLVVAARDVLELHDRSDAQRLLGEIIQDRHDVRALRQLVEELDFGALALTEGDVLARAESLLASGRIVGVRVRRPARALDQPTIRPLVDPDEPDDPLGPGTSRRAPETPRPEEDTTWISFEVRLENGGLVPGLAVSVRRPDGARRDGVLDAMSRFRELGIPASGGTCDVTLHPHGGFAGPTTIALRGDDVWLEPDRDQTVSLACARHHRLVVVEGRTEVVLVDGERGPFQNERCNVQIGDRVVSCVTDSAGMLTVVHPRTAESCSIELVDLPLTLVS